ncbi:hypothetical protein [Streptomyces asoensis]|uniref:Uncharacterized protein n=1 Tax=Streptomyces asoensis TaxID=249586 RepID=A0ABQ3S2K7_9ACTN|nr:hypothetical protein [Streptomyces asoensis]GGQ90181.1 hypothetical protein GCM10010496_63530 [Streptomyces asoensis]GHI62354.1 hypothetical protein Saso_40040 [Streptomyces asoensis]
MTDHNGHPQQPQYPQQPQPPEQPGPRPWEIPPQASQVHQAPPVQQVPAPAPAAAPPPTAVPAPQPAQAPQVFQAEHAWIDGYEPGNPWQASLCVKTPYGTFAYPLTPNTIPELLEQMVLVAQEQQGMPVGFDEEPELSSPDEEALEEEQQASGSDIHNGRAARLTGWAVVHDLWEREDPTARIVMGAVVVVLLLLGIVLT